MIEIKPYIEEHYIHDFFEMLNKSAVRYVLIKNIADELPKKLKDGKDIDILVHFDDREKFSNAMRRTGWLYRVHPLGRENGWTFGYNLPECQFWQYSEKKINQTFYVDVCFKLMCKSLMPKTWIPLDERIQQLAWKKRKWNKELNCWQIGAKVLLVYLFIRAVFDKRLFKEEYIQEIEKYKKYLEDEEVYNLLESVFYKFTDNLILLAKNNNYNSIISRYITYQKY